MSKGTLVHYELDRDEVTALLREVRNGLRYSENHAERNLESYLLLFQHEFTHISGAIDLKSTIEILGTAAHDPLFLANQQMLIDKTPNVMHMTFLPDKAYEWGKQFLLQILKEVRTLICTESIEYKNLKKEYNNYPKAFVVAISTALMAKLGISNPMALGIATLILLTLAQATKNSFCKMTNEQILRKIDRTVNRRRKNQSSTLKKNSDN